MSKTEWAAFFHVAGIAKIVNSLCFNKFFRKGTVLVVARSAIELAFFYGVVRKFAHIACDIAVAAIAFFIIHARCVFGVNGVAGGARNFGTFVG